MLERFRNDTLPPAPRDETARCMQDIHAALAERGLPPLAAYEQAVVTWGTIDRDGAETRTYAFVEDENHVAWPRLTKVFEREHNRIVTDYSLTSQEARVSSRSETSGAHMVERKGADALRLIDEAIQEVANGLRDTEGGQTIMIMPYVPEQDTEHA